MVKPYLILSIFSRLSLTRAIHMPGQHNRVTSNLFRLHKTVASDAANLGKTWLGAQSDLFGDAESIPCWEINDLLGQDTLTPGLVDLYAFLPLSPILTTLHRISCQTTVLLVDPKVARGTLGVLPTLNLTMRGTSWLFPQWVDVWLHMNREIWNPRPDYLQLCFWLLGAVNNSMAVMQHFKK